MNGYIKNNNVLNIKFWFKSSLRTAKKSSVPSSLSTHETSIVLTGGIKSPAFSGTHPCHLHFGWLVKVAQRKCDFFFCLMRKPLIPHILTLVWFVTWFPSSQISNQILHHVHLLKLSIKQRCIHLCVCPSRPCSYLFPLKRPDMKKALCGLHQPVSSKPDSPTARQLTRRHVWCLVKDKKKTHSRAQSFISELSLLTFLKKWWDR